jgi:hypothetical protein
MYYCVLTVQATKTNRCLPSLHGHLACLSAWPRRSPTPLHTPAPPTSLLCRPLSAQDAIFAVLDVTDRVHSW